MMACNNQSTGSTRPVYVVVMGVSGCGKSTIAQKIAAGLPDAVFIDGDDLHPQANIEKMSSGVPLQDEDRWPWLDIIRHRAGESLSQQRSFVVACSALKREYRQRLCNPKTSGWFIYLDGSRALITARQSARQDHFMPASLIESQFETLEPPVNEPNVISVSIDQSIEQVVADALQQLQPLLANE